MLANRLHQPDQAAGGGLNKLVLANRLAFTLFEVLIALVVIALTVTVSLGGMLGVLRFSERMNQRTEAIAQFEELLFKIEAGEGYAHDIETQNEIGLHDDRAFGGPVYIYLDDHNSLHSFYFRYQSGRESKG